jgi:hypothetical protein
MLLGRETPEYIRELMPFMPGQEETDSEAKVLNREVDVPEAAFASTATTILGLAITAQKYAAMALRISDRR